MRIGQAKVAGEGPFWTSTDLMWPQVLAHEDRLLPSSNGPPLGHTYVFPENWTWQKNLMKEKNL
jgi:hypothetical protein